MNPSSVNFRDRDSGWSRAVTAGLFSVFAVEMLLGGPGFWHVAGIPVRRTLVAALTLWMLLLCAAGYAPLRRGHMLLLWTLALVMTVWIVLIPTLRAAQPLSNAVQEGFPLALLFAGVLAHAYFRDNPLAWARLRRTCGGALATVAAMAIVVWIVGTFVFEDAVLVAIGFLNYFTWGNESLEPSVYVQQMPDGFFRVMWITSSVLPVGLIYSLAARRPWAAALFAAALFVSYTRALWLCAALGMAWVVLRHVAAGSRVRINLAVAGAGLLVMLGLLGADLARDSEDSVVLRAANRLVTTFSDESASERVDQVTPLIDAWLSSPVLGLGLGSAASVSRSDVAPYLYELTYLALLMKLGVVGVLMFAAIAASLLLRTARSGTRVAHVEASVLAFLLACSTNPYLLNLVGLSLLTFLFIDLDLTSRSGRVSTQRHVRADGPNRPAAA